MRRLDSASAAIADALRTLPVAGEPGHSSPADLAAGLASIFRKRFGPCERLTVASAAMMALDLDAAEELAEATLCDLRAGPPMVTFMDVREDGRDWARFASPGELKTYFGAIWNRLPGAERASFLSAVRPKRRAA